ncbi:hypothetical protein Hsw_1638 [Hymenobacter swuensis DY53]|uniref:Uncharacterized protein n=1 Tax=Hymenobacter swuensis DY53 TaxID=1227739 RepID=W8EXC3_9BACT|nr:hypothetical protein Hsw_1638 [Hymenobacter swuensis DY53]
MKAVRRCLNWQAGCYKGNYNSGASFDITGPKLAFVKI